MKNKKINECFENYKNKHLGESIIFFATGPSLQSYLDSDLLKNKKFDNFIKIGCNSASLIKELELDYYFVGDPMFGGGPNAFKINPDPYLNANIKKQKFCRTHISNFLNKDPDDFLVYETSRYTEKNHKYYPLDIVLEPINQVGSISMDVIQFCLFCGFKKIYLVGQDCNYNQPGKSSHINQVKSMHPVQGARVLRFWNKIKLFIDANYKDVEIFIVNPVSLKIWPEISLQDVIKKG
jgi:hypothetical protein